MLKPDSSQESRWALVSGSPVSFVAPQRVRGNTRPIFIRDQPIPDDSASVPVQNGTSQPSSQLCSCTIHYFGGCLLGRQSWGRSEVVESPVSCAKWQWFELKATWGWIGMIYSQCQSCLTLLCVRACQHPGSDLFTSLHWLKGIGNQETVREKAERSPGQMGHVTSWGAQSLYHTSPGAILGDRGDWRYSEQKQSKLRPVTM